VRAVWYERTGPAAEVLTFGEMATPIAGPGEVRVRLEASGVNPADVGRRAGGIAGREVEEDGGGQRFGLAPDVAADDHHRADLGDGRPERGDDGDDAIAGDAGNDARWRLTLRGIDQQDRALARGEAA